MSEPVGELVSAPDSGARNVLEEVRTLARERLALGGELKPGSRLIEDLGLDSLQLQGLAVEVENHFRICLEPEDEENIETVADLVAAIQDKLTLSKPAE